ncbi:putative uncharacterized protein [Waddlia chondrophila 2032/99]|uniref:DUF2937 family protein n=2 Tax=Waddlia chondrophila TaxID=71667 RepID=D6YW74_WADCW|nr:DUF2937 family protein [Waddlia chondrophila]ADI38385.1 conserved hypothetical protein [Waddlia chondrophila WSU 86-1044]CCB91469.1 putative uncharacterized protein [Waddlia chondrophila 2032/99]
MRNWLFGLIDRFLVVAGALIFSQAPQFFSQYMHRLAGHVEELKIHIKTIQQAALKSGKELPEYLMKFSLHQDPDVSMQGQMMQGMLNRYADLNQSLSALLDSTPLTRPFVFLQHFNFEIAKATAANFQPGVLLTVEGAAYAVLGMGIGYIVFRFIHAVVFFFFKKIYS